MVETRCDVGVFHSPFYSGEWARRINWHETYQSICSRIRRGDVLALLSIARARLVIMCVGFIHGISFTHTCCLSHLGIISTLQVLEAQLQSLDLWYVLFHCFHCVIRMLFLNIKPFALMIRTNISVWRQHLAACGSCFFSERLWSFFRILCADKRTLQTTPRALPGFCPKPSTHQTSHFRCQRLESIREPNLLQDVNPSTTTENPFNPYKDGHWFIMFWSHETTTWTFKMWFKT